MRNQVASTVKGTREQVQRKEPGSKYRERNQVASTVKGTREQVQRKEPGSKYS